MPTEMQSVNELEESLGKTASYRTVFFHGKINGKGVKEHVCRIVAELMENSDCYMTDVLISATNFLETYGCGRDMNCFKLCLRDWSADIEEEPALHRYVSMRADNPDSYADILCVLFWYTMTLWKKETFLKFLTNRYQNGISNQWDFSLDRVILCADRGFEKTIFKTEIVEKNGVKWLDVKVNFTPTAIRPHSPAWVSVVFKMIPPRDIQYFNSISFRLAPVIDVGMEDCGTEQVVVELKPERRDSVGHYSKPFVLKDEPIVGVINLREVQRARSEYVEEFEELCFVVNLNDLTGVESDDVTKLKGHFRISQIRLN